MRGVVCGGMVTALETLGLTTTFDEVVGSSAGAIAGAYFVAGQAAFGTRIFYEDINNRRFIDLRRLALGQPVVSVDFLLDEVCRRPKRLDWQAVLAARSRLVCMATSLTRQRAIAIDRFAGENALFDAMRASARIPGTAGPPVMIDGEPLIDASVVESIPVATAATRGATHVLALMTRPHGCVPERLDIAERYRFVPWLERRSPGLGRLYRGSPARYALEVEVANGRAAAPGNIPVLGIAPAAGTPEVGNIEKDAARLQAGALAGFHAVFDALDIPRPAGLPPALRLDRLRR